MMYLLHESKKKKLPAIIDVSGLSLQFMKVVESERERNRGRERKRMMRIKRKRKKTKAKTKRTIE